MGFYSLVFRVWMLGFGESFREQRRGGDVEDSDWWDAGFTEQVLGVICIMFALILLYVEGNTISVGLLLIRMFYGM